MIGKKIKIYNSAKDREETWTIVQEVKAGDKVGPAIATSDGYLVKKRNSVKLISKDRI